MSAAADRRPDRESDPAPAPRDRCPGQVLPVRGTEARSCDLAERRRKALEAGRARFAALARAMKDGQ